MENAVCGIYCIENTITSKKYIGQAINIRKRWQDHKSELRNDKHPNIHLQRAWNLYGEESFNFSVIDICEDSELNAKEIYWINYYDTYKNGYNRTLGGEGTRGFKLSEERRAQISKDLTGRPVKEQTRKLMSEHMKYQYNDPVFLEAFYEVIEAQKEAIKCYNENGFIMFFESIHDAARYLDLEATNICKVLKGKYKTSGGYTFCYEDEELTREDLNYLYSLSKCENVKTKDMKIEELDSEGNVIYVFNTIVEITKKYPEVDGSSVSKVCRGKLTNTKGHIFRYKY